MNRDDWEKLLTLFVLSVPAMVLAWIAAGPFGVLGQIMAVIVAFQITARIYT